MCPGGPLWMFDNNRQIDDMLSNGERRSEAAQTVIEDAKNGYHYRVRDYLDNIGMWGSCTATKFTILRQMMEGPQEFKTIADTFHFITERAFSYQEFFNSLKGKDSDINQTIWSMHRKAPTKECADVCAELLAEHIRHELLLDIHYSINAAIVVDASETIKLKDALARGERISSFIEVQNALVDYVAQNADLPLHRGAAFLSVMANETDSAIWTRKMIDIRDFRVDDIRKGPAIIWRPVYEEPAP